MKKNWKRLLSLLLTVCMIAGLLVMPAAADGEGDEGGETGDTPAATETYAIAVTGPENGAVIVKKDGEAANVADEGDTLTIEAEPAEGFEVDTITVTDEDGTDVEVNDGVFTMPAKAVTVTVTFKTATTEGGGEGGGEEPEDPPATRTVTFEGDHFSVEEIKQGEADLELADGVYTANTTDDITFKVTADENYEITTVEVGGTALTATDGVYTIDAGESDVTVTITATATEIDPPTTEYNVTVTAGENGTATASVATAAAGTEVALTITPDTGYVVDQITSGDVTVTDNKFTMPEKDVTINVTFKAEEITPPDTPVDLSTKTVTLDKTAPVVDDVLTASVEGVNADDVDFIWKVDGAVVTDNKTATYTVAADDMGKVIKVKAQAKTGSTTYEKATAEVSTDPVVGKTMTVTATGYSDAYDGRSHNISVTGVPEGGIVQYSPDGETDWSMLPPLHTNVTNTTVYYRVTAPGYQEATGSATITITKAAAPNIKIQASKSQVAAMGGDVTFTVTGVPAGTAAPTATCSQGDEVTLTPDGDNYTCTKTFVALDEGQTEDVVHTVTLSWSDSNYEDFTQAPKAVVTQKGHGAVVAEPATDLKFAEASTAKLASLGIAFTPVSGGNNKLVYTIDEAALLAAWGTEAGKAVLQGSGVFNAELNRAYVCVMFKLPADVASDWTVTQTVDGEAGAPCLLDGGHTFDVFTVGEDKYLGDWYSIAEINGETLAVLPAIAWDNITYEFKNASNETKHIVEINMERKVTAAPVNPVEYTVTVNHDDGGTATASVDKAAAGTEVTLTVTPATGYVVDQITSDDVTVTGNKFIMPAKDVDIRVTFKEKGGDSEPEKYPVTVDHDAGGNATADKTKAVEGESVTLTITPNSGYELADIVVTAENGAPVTVKNNAFTMPACGVTVTVTFKPESGEDPTPSGEPFDVVPGNLGQIDENSELPANGLAEGYTATAVKTADGDVTVTLKATTLFKHKNALGTEGFWIGFGMPIEEGKTYTYCLVEDGVDGDPIPSVPGRVQTVGDKDYNTIYFNLDAEDAGKTQTVVVKQTEGDNAITYTVNITVDELTDPLTKALTEADELRRGTKVSETGADVSTSDKWVPQDMTDALYEAIKEAEKAKTGTDAERVAAAAALNKVIERFKAAMKDGTLSSGGGGGGGRPNYGPSGNSASNNTVDKTSETLADGTKRDTETAKDGTVTVTETRPNGTKTVTTTTPDGEITTDVTLGNGVKSATVSVPVKDAGNGTVAIIVKDDGTEEVIRNSFAEDGNVVFELNRDAQVKIVNNAKKFVDMTNHWAKDYVDYVTAREFFNGVDATHFSPDTAMTRAMLAAVLYRLVGETNVDGTANYKDVAANTWYTDAVNWASKVGVVNGYPDGTFAPNRAITREELVVMFYRYAGSPAVDETASLVAYQDADQVSSWAETAMRWAVKNGIINGKSVDTLLPRGNATRAEVSAVLQRYVNLAK